MRYATKPSRVRAQHVLAICPSDRTALYDPLPNSRNSLRPINLPTSGRIEAIPSISHGIHRYIRLPVLPTAAVPDIDKYRDVMLDQQ